MATVATRLGRNSVTNKIPKQIPLTPTGLLMEGDYTHNAEPQKARQHNLDPAAVAAYFRMA